MVENYGGDAREECHECGSTDFEVYRSGVSYNVECAECGEPVGMVPLEKQIGGFRVDQ